VFPYWLLFLAPAWIAITHLRPVQVHGARWASRWYLMFTLLVLMVGLRYQVGGDWITYDFYVQRAAQQSLSAVLSQGDPAYEFLNWLTNYIGGGVYFVNFVCALLFTWGLLAFCRTQPRPWLALVVAMPYLVTVVAMGYTRQATAIGLAMLALVALADRKILRFAIFIVLAAMFHKTAVILMPLAVLASTRRRLWTIFWIGVSTYLAYVLLLQDAVQGLEADYLGARYDSSGAAIRVAMNAVPAAIFLLFRRRFILPAADRAFWTWMSIGGLVFIPLLLASPSSTAVDRVALYWIPLQLYVLSRLPDALGRHGGANAVWVLLIVGYSVLVLLVWLFFAQTAFAWLPYQFYPFVALGQ